MNETNQILSIIAYYFSEYNYDALEALGYSNYNEAFSKISLIFGKDKNNSYLRRRRDEFDALPESSSKRNGYRNRPPIKFVVEMASHLRKFDFNELTDIVKSMICNIEMPFSLATESNNESIVLPDDVEYLMNISNPFASFKIKTIDKKIRVYSMEIIRQLKSLYSNRCQICGCSCGEKYGSDLIHAHHIDYFAKSLDNSAINILIVCPNHHGIIHDTNPTFDRSDLTYHYPNGYVEGLTINFHL